MKRAIHLRFSHRLLLIIAVIYVLLSGCVVLTVSHVVRQQALEDARTYAGLLIERNLSTHRYFAAELKPAVFELVGTSLPDQYFDPRWMSSTFAIHTMQGYLTKSIEQGYYYKECAIDARSLKNEADPFERAFLERAAKDPDIREWSGVREIGGQPYYVVLQRGETMEQGCLICHSDPAKAPKGLVSRFGEARSFGRNAGDLVSAVSVRIPLSTPYRKAAQTTQTIVLAISGFFAVTLLLLFMMTRRYLEVPLLSLRDAVSRSGQDDSLLGQPIQTGGSPEVQEVADAYSGMSARVKHSIETLEAEVARRTETLRTRNAELQEALDQIRTLRGIIPICASCKKVRDDQGYWNQVESYVSRHTEAEFSHGICPDCLERLYPDVVPEDGEA